VAAHTLCSAASFPGAVAGANSTPPLAQVLTTRQWALVIVHAYPYLMTVESSLEAFASHRGMQPKSVLLKAAQTDDMESDWLALQEYIELISQENPHDYLPLSKCSAFKSKVTQNGSKTLMPFGTEAAINLHYRL